jgi:hypothetical protein
VLPKWILAQRSEMHFSAVRRAFGVLPQIAIKLVSLDRIRIKSRLMERVREILMYLSEGHDVQKIEITPMQPASEPQRVPRDAENPQTIAPAPDSRASAGAEIIAKDLACPTRQIGIYVQNGMPTKHGKYSRVNCLLWYMTKLKNDISAAEKNSDLEFEQTRLQRVTADLKEIELAEIQGELIPLENYTKFVGQRFLQVRQNALSLPAQIAPQLEGQGVAVISATLRKKVDEILAPIQNTKTNIPALANSSKPQHKPPTSAEKAAKCRKK